MGEVYLDDDKVGRMGFQTPPNRQDQVVGCQRRKNIPTAVQFGYGRSRLEIIWEMFVLKQRTLWFPP